MVRFWDSFRDSSRDSSGIRPVVVGGRGKREEEGSSRAWVDAFLQDSAQGKDVGVQQMLWRAKENAEEGEVFLFSLDHVVLETHLPGQGDGTYHM